ncbi:concanavalin A-like lectin/glucanase domain-containing protein [Colletotrichum godetiae]|uniref:Concanavalin A-like lectin/glucanase domain-containing protein n=1 Tax=Colletotrichum godetiae TaxID=1209918 RepID=A0AAJ0ALG5_9PEZI|nr:concanavalin A-like lectin/glucanase domain-containing protein [Colletotrichum godetiae]KAK1673846.1 concanavalin A-like lectin/glucanase domain-containing protein [Colletotrichum godetiae]
MLSVMSISGLAASLLLFFPLIEAKVPNVSGFELTWADDSEGRRDALPDPENPRNVRVNGKGSLQITAIRDLNGGWTSSRIKTQRTDFVAQPGGKMRIQASLKTPNMNGHGLGYWPAFWTLGSEYRGNYWNWPYVGEIGIMENPNVGNRIWGVLHCDRNPGGFCDESNGIGNSTSCPNSVCSGNLHTYTIEVDRSARPEILRWFVDGVQYHQVSETQLSEAIWTQTVHKPHFILLNMAMGGGFPDGISALKTPLNSTLSGGTYEADCSQSHRRLFQEIRMLKEDILVLNQFAMIVLENAALPSITATKNYIAKPHIVFLARRAGADTNHKPNTNIREAMQHASGHYGSRSYTILTFEQQLDRQGSFYVY